MIKKEKTMICFEVLETFEETHFNDDEIHFDDPHILIHQTLDELTLKIYFQTFLDEITKDHDDLIFEIFFDDFREIQEDKNKIIKKTKMNQ
jgi:hypothetical protein